MRAWHSMLDLVLPPVCAGCGDPVSRETVLCPACDARLPRLEIDCAAPAPLAGCTAAVAYRGVAEEWVRRFKHPAAGIAALDVCALAVARALILEAAAGAPGRGPDLVVPVPPHRRSLYARGFHAAGLLARTVARARRVPCRPRALVARRETPSQTGLHRADRRRNIRGAFAAHSPLPPRIWVVDDVITTGSTLAEAAHHLHRAGAREVIGVCVAATPAPRDCAASSPRRSAQSPDTGAWRQRVS